MNFIDRANSSKLVLPGVVYSIFVIIIIGMKKTHMLLRIYQRQFSLNVWAGIIDKFLIGPFFLDGKLTGTKYVDFLSTRLREILEQVPVDIRLGMRFMHDGVPPHFSLVARQFFNRHFANKWIGCGGPICMACSFSGFQSIRFSFVGTFKIYCIRNVD